MRPLPTPLPLTLRARAAQAMLAGAALAAAPASGANTAGAADDANVATAALVAEFGQRWMAHDARLVVRLPDADAQARWRGWRWFIGTLEVTALARLAAPGRIVLVPGAARWPAGQAELVVREGAGGQEVARLPLRVLDAAGLHDTQLTPRLDLGSESRAADKRSDGQPTSPRTGHADASVGLGAAWKGRREDWAFEAATNLAGHSQREKALRYGQLGGQAPKLDLADYRAAVGWRDQLQLELGHLSAGSHPLLASSFASRGLGFKARLAPVADVAVHALRGSGVVGWSDPSGLAEDEHRQHLLTLGAELVASRPGALRAELSLLDATLLPLAAFNAGTVADAERSRGVGLRLSGASEGGRVAGELALAQVRHTHPFDPELAQDGALVPVRESRAHALLGTLRVGLVRHEALELNLDSRYERIAPQYRSPAAGVSADQEAARVALQAAANGATAQMQAGTRVDNLARIATLLRTRTDELGAGLSLPLARWLAAPPASAGAAGWSPWPALSLNARRVHQHAVNAPRPEDSGIAATHRPDQVDAEQQLQLSWALGAHAVSYGVTRAGLDNRQPGRERADFRRLSHQGSVNAQLGERWRGGVSVSRTRSLSVETGLVSRTVGGSLQLDWQASERWAVAGSVRHDLADDSADRARLAGDGAQLQLTHRFDVIGWEAKKLPGQFFVRLGYEAQRQRDAVFGTAGAFRAAWADLGLAFSFY